VQPLGVELRVANGADERNTPAVERKLEPLYKSKQVGALGAVCLLVDLPIPVGVAVDEVVRAFLRVGRAGELGVRGAMREFVYLLRLLKWALCMYMCDRNNLHFNEAQTLSQSQRRCARQVAGSVSAVHKLGPTEGEGDLTSLYHTQSVCVPSSPSRIRTAQVPSVGVNPPTGL
jgi:hypothetical protein